MVSNNLFNILNNDINRLKGERSYLFSVVPYARSGIGKKIDQEFIEQTIRSMELPQRDSTARAARLAQFSQQMQEFLIRLLHEKDPENVSAEQRLAHIDIDNLLLYGFRTYNIHLPFTYEIMTKQGLLNRVKGGAPKNFYYVELFQQDLVKKGYYLGVSFESVQPVLLENMGMAVFSFRILYFRVDVRIYYYDRYHYASTEIIGHQERFLSII